MFLDCVFAVRSVTGLTAIALVLDFTKRHPPQSFTAEVRKLPYPLVIPQKRPGSGRRGFVNAYAPALEKVRIDSETFGHFIMGLEESIVVSF
jgi:hypothetical protein